MANISGDIESVIKSLRESINELEAVKNSLEGKTLSRHDKEDLRGYIEAVADYAIDMTGSIEDLTYMASGPGGYKIGYIDHTYHVAGRSIHSSEKPFIKLEA